MGINYIDDIIIGGKDHVDHDRLLRCVLQCLAQIGFHLNPYKFKITWEHVIFLDYDVWPGCFRVETYLHKHKYNLPDFTSSRKIMKILGVFNFCKHFCLDLAWWVLPIQEELKRDKRYVVQELTAKVKRIWVQILAHNIFAAMNTGFDNYHIMVD